MALESWAHSLPPSLLVSIQHSTTVSYFMTSQVITIPQHSPRADEKHCDSINRPSYFLVLKFHFLIFIGFLRSVSFSRRLFILIMTLDPHRKWRNISPSLTFLGLININLKTLLHLCWLFLPPPLWMCVRRMMLMFQARLFLEKMRIMSSILCPHTRHILLYCSESLLVRSSA